MSLSAPSSSPTKRSLKCSMEGMLDYGVKKHEYYDEINWSTWMVGVGRLPRRVIREYKDDGRLRLLVGKLCMIIGSNIHYFGPRQLSNIVHGWGKIGREWDVDGVMVKAMKEVTGESTGDIPTWCNEDTSPITISNICWATAKLDLPFPVPSFFRHIDSLSHVLFSPPFEPQSISNVIWSAARVNEHHGFLPNERYDGDTMHVKIPRIWEAMEENAVEFTERASPQSISVVALACYKMGVDCEKLFGAIDEQADRLVQRDSMQAVSNLVYAVYKGGYKMEKLNQKIELLDGDEFLGNSTLTASQCQSLSNLCWSISRLSIPASSLFRSINDNAELVLEKNAGQGISTIAWAFAVLDDVFWAKHRHGIESHDFFQAIDDDIERIYPLLSLEGLSNLLYAAATLDYEMPSLLKVFSSNISDIKKIGPGDGRGLSNISWYLAKTGHYDAGFFSLLEKNKAQLMNDDTTNGKVFLSFAWSICLLLACEKHESLLRDMWDKILLLRESRESLTKVELTMALQVYTTAGVYLSTPLTEPSSEFLEEMKVQATSTKISGSRGQDEVMGYTEILNVGRVEEEVSPWTIDSLAPALSDSDVKFLSIDAAIVSEKLAIEYNGPGHFLTTWKGEDGGKRWRKAKRKARDIVQGKERVEERKWKKIVRSEGGIDKVMEGLDDDDKFGKKKLGWFEFEEVEDVEEEDGGEGGDWRRDEFTLVENGVTKYKKKILSELGWNLVSVPFYEWAEMETEIEKEMYLRRKFEEATGKECKVEITEIEKKKEEEEERDRER
eukprot:CAMPEP_0118642420 /NCGR_PEP_ID=MMETSP0785-20121206/5824_1 /TAXON_ID=91992 /ORGANISM="Bolidomonas pacifica, Strain CCMP 1866" /LENGTH=781 /DNA_ID=CAMNT_0006533967 /DNA_START=638 /DNA_END=2980 /DNA_ORIENTATION=-